MDKGQPPVLHSATEEACSTSENRTLANAGAGCSGVALEKPESPAEPIQQDLLVPQEEVINLDP